MGANCPHPKSRTFQTLLAKDFPENKVAARKGGKIAGDAREKLEIKTKNDIMRTENYLTLLEGRKRMQGRK